MSRLSQRIENFNKASDLFFKVQERFMLAPLDDVNKLALTQCFEMVFELAWKVLKDYLSQKGIEVFTPKDVIKEAFGANILPDGQIWIDMNIARNASSHEYNMEKVDEILKNISTLYSLELRRFKERVKSFEE